MTARYHLDTDYLVYALSIRGPERTRLRELADSEAALEISAIAWYEFTRGPRDPAQMVLARELFGDGGVVPFTSELAEQAAERFRALRNPRRRAQDIAIGVTAAHRKAVLLTRNTRDFEGIEGLSTESSAEGKRR